MKKPNKRRPNRTHYEWMTFAWWVRFEGLPWEHHTRQELRGHRRA